MATVSIASLEKKVATDTIDKALQTFGLNYVEVAGTLGVDRRTILRYRKQDSIPTPSVRARLEKLREITYLLGKVFVDRDAQLEWLYSPVPLLRDRRPIDLIRKGDLDEVLSILTGIYTGASS
jgi:uncharacterized protein (DUF2384 family)